MEIISQNEKYKGDFKNLKSDYFLRKLFDNIKKYKTLKIMKYNKKLQNRLNLSINDYKEYSKLYSSIEIELKLSDNEHAENDKFINIPEEDKEYYHIYFDNSNEEIKRNYLKANEKVNTIKIIINYKVKSFKHLFYYCKHISSIFFKKFHRINITDMNGMFYECSSLKELNLSNFNTNNVNNMSNMFRGCSSLKELNLSNFNTNNITDTSFMFSKCSSLTELNLSNFNTNNVNYMIEMFSGCLSLKKLNLSNFNTNNVINMTDMFSGCSSLKELNSNFNIKNVRYMRGMFSGCSDELIKKIKAQYKDLLIY